MKACESRIKAEYVSSSEKADTTDAESTGVEERQPLVDLNAAMPDSSDQSQGEGSASADITCSPRSADSHGACENSATSRTTSNRKANKPLMERRRRERMNIALAQLKEIVCDDQKTSPKYAKMEKADILEATVKFVERVAASVSSNDAGSHYMDGYKSCLEAAARFLALYENQELADRLVQHLGTSVSPLRQAQAVPDHDYAAAGLPTSKTPSSPVPTPSSAAPLPNPQTPSSPLAPACADVSTHSASSFSTPLRYMRSHSVPTTFLTSGHTALYPSYVPSHGASAPSKSFHWGGPDDYYRYRYPWHPRPVLPPHVMDYRYSPYQVPARMAPTHHAAATGPSHSWNSQEEPLALVTHSRRGEEERQEEVGKDTQGKEEDVVEANEINREVEGAEAPHAEDDAPPNNDGEDMWQPWM